LKLLRGIIGLSQPDLAELIGFSVDVIRSLEIGRRGGGKLSGEMIIQIRDTLGTEWAEESGQWVFLWNDNGQLVPYTHEHFASFRAELLNEALDRSMVVYYLAFEFVRFLEAIPATSFNGWFWRLDSLLDQWSKVVEFKRTAFQLDPHWERKAARILGYRKMFPSLLQGEEKKFSELIERARQEQKTLAARSEAEGQERYKLEQAEYERALKRKPKKQPRSPQAPGAE
jgi:transcriptional regulator with XRE-family HTH domain